MKRRVYSANSSAIKQCSLHLMQFCLSIMVSDKRFSNKEYKCFKSSITFAHEVTLKQMYCIHGICILASGANVSANLHSWEWSTLLINHILLLQYFIVCVGNMIISSSSFPDDRGAGRSIIGGGAIFIYSCSQTVKTIDFKI